MIYSLRSLAMRINKIQPNYQNILKGKELAEAALEEEKIAHWYNGLNNKELKTLNSLLTEQGLLSAKEYFES